MVSVVCRQSLSVLYSVVSLDDTLSKHESSRLETLTYLLKVIVDDDCPDVLRNSLLQFIEQVPHQVLLHILRYFLVLWQGCSYVLLSGLISDAFVVTSY